MILKNLLILCLLSLATNLTMIIQLIGKMLVYLDSEQSYYKRMVSEMIHIKRQDNCLNKQSDTERFPEIYYQSSEKSPHIELPSPLSSFPSPYINSVRQP